MNARAMQRIKRAERRLAILRRCVRWWGKASAAEKLAVASEVRECFPGATTLGACECNLYGNAEDYLAACGWRLDGTHYVYQLAQAS